MKVGIGVLTTAKRKFLFAECMDAINTYSKFSNDVCITYVQDNGDGVAKSKNNLLKKLIHCDYIFLFEDDCWPLQNDYIEFILNASVHSNNHHFCFLQSPFYQIKNQFFYPKTVINSYTAAGAPMIFLTKKVLEKVGGFYEGYKSYGYEHIGYSIRIHQAQLTNDFFICPQNTEAYIYSKDYSVKDFFNDQSNISIKEKQILTDINRLIWEKQDRSIYQKI